MSKLSAGILLYRRVPGGLEVFLVHPGGPYWAGKDHGAWSIPKGEYAEGEDPLSAARREFHEETGFTVAGDFRPLAPIKQPSGKLISVWAIEGDCDPSVLKSNTFMMDWPPGSGKQGEFPEVDRGAWFSTSEARTRLARGQVPFIDEFCALLATGR